MRGAVLPDADGIVRHDIRHGNIHESREAHGGLAIVGEHEEGRTVRLYSAVELHTVRYRRHRVFTDSEMNVSAFVGIGRKRSVFDFFRILHVRKIGGGEVGTAAHELGNHRRQLIQNHGRGLAGSHGLIEREELFHRFEVGLFVRHRRFVFRREFGIGVFVFREHLLPLHFLFRTRVRR